MEGVREPIDLVDHGELGRGDPDAVAAGGPFPSDGEDAMHFQQVSHNGVVVSVRGSSGDPERGHPAAHCWVVRCEYLDVVDASHLADPAITQVTEPGFHDRGTQGLVAVQRRWHGQERRRVERARVHPRAHVVGRESLVAEG